METARKHESLVRCVSLGSSLTAIPGLAFLRLVSVFMFRCSQSFINLLTESAQRMLDGRGHALCRRLFEASKLLKNQLEEDTYSPVLDALTNSEVTNCTEHI